MTLAKYQLQSIPRTKRIHYLPTSATLSPNITMREEDILQTLPPPHNLAQQSYNDPIGRDETALLSAAAITGTFYMQRNQHRI